VECLAVHANDHQSIAICDVDDRARQGCDQPLRVMIFKADALKEPLTKGGLDRTRWFWRSWAARPGYPGRAGSQQPRLLG